MQLHTIDGLADTQQGQAHMVRIAARAGGPQYGPEAPAATAAHKPTIAPALKI